MSEYDALARATAAALGTAVGKVRRRSREALPPGELRMPEMSALAQIDRSAPVTIAELARMHQITPQAMGATFASLESHGLIGRAPDPADRRRSLFSVTAAGLEALRTGRGAITERMAAAMAESFTPEEIKTLAAAVPLLERLATLI